MGTVTVTSAGFAPLPSSPPSNWPPGVTYPSGSPNGTRAYTVSDADIVRILTWTAATQFGKGASSTPTLAQILLAWIQYWWTVTSQQEQGFSTTAPVVPPPISVT